MKIFLLFTEQASVTAFDKVPKELLKTTLDQQLTKGVLLTRENNKIMYEKRGKVIQTPENPKLVNPLSASKILKHKQKKSSKQKAKALATGNVETSLGAKIFDTLSGYLPFNSGLSGGRSTETADEVSSSISEDHDEKVRSALLPMASYRLPLEDMKFTPSAFNDLKVIDKMIEETQQAEAIQEKCVQFTKDYGTHIRQGPVHYGGAFERKKRKKNQSRISKTEQNEGTTCSGAVGLNLPGLVNADAQCESSTTVAQPNEAIDSGDSQSLELVQIGGLATDDFNQWKEGLPKNPSLWSNVATDDEMSSVTEVIKNNYFNKFKHATEIAQLLLDAGTRNLRNN